MGVCMVLAGTRRVQPMGINFPFCQIPNLTLSGTTISLLL
jgi:hypothetical protein